MRPDHVLTRIMRQGEGSEILAFAAAVREGRPLPAMTDPVAGEVRRLDPRAPVPWHWTEADGSAGRLDAVIVQSNAVRRRINAEARAARGRDPEGPALPGDLVQANRRLNEGQIYNGMTLTVADVELGGRALVLRSDDDGYLHRVWLGDRVVDQEGCGLNYGYAFTCHKAQGSEWDRVLVYPPHAGSPAEMRRWTYHRDDPGPAHAGPRDRGLTSDGEEPPTATSLGRRQVEGPSERKGTPMRKIPAVPMRRR
jgi:exodeoxyribonuclease-5